MSNDQSLSSRETEILRLVATGASNKEIAQKLSITTNTVKVHVRNIFGKIGVSSRTEAAMYAVKNGLVVDQTQVDTKKDLSQEENHSTVAQPAKRFHFLQGFNRINQIFFFSLILVLVIMFATAIYFQIQGKNSRDNATLLDASARWTQLAHLTTPRSGAAAAFVGNSIYIFGGETSSGVSGVAEKISIDYQKNEGWMPIKDKPTSVKNVQAVTVDGLIYIPGGELQNGEVTKVVDVYDPFTNVWNSKNTMPVPRSGYSLVTFDGWIYLIGGWDGNGYTSTVYRYDPSSDIWEELSPMKSPRAYGGAVIVGGKLFVLGGKNQTGDLDSIEVFDLTVSDSSDRQWKEDGKLPEPRSYMSVFSLVDYVFIIGGTNQEGEPLENLVYQPQSGDWQEFLSPVEGIWLSPALTGFGSELFVVGGKLDDVYKDNLFSFKAIYTALLPIVK